MARPTAESQVLLSTKDLTKSFGKLMAVARVNVDIYTGEVLCIVGSNGAGKTTLLKLISGGHTPTEGEIKFLDRDVSRLGLVRRARLGIIYSFQIPALFENLSAWDNISLALLTREKKTFVFFSRLVRFKKIRGDAEEILHMFNVPRDIPAAALPHGQRKLLDAAIAFALNPRLLLLDEPTSGVSSDEKCAVMDTIMPNIKNQGTTTVIVEHDMEIVARYGQRVVVMDQGRVLAEGDPDVVMQDEEVRAAVLGRSPFCGVGLDAE